MGSVGAEVGQSGATVPLDGLTVGQQTHMARLNLDGSTANTDTTAKGALLVYTQIASFGQNDLALILKGHDDFHLSYAAPSNQFQTLTFAGWSNGDTFTLTYGGQTTANIVYSTVGATLVANIVAALTALTNISTAASLGPWAGVDVAVSIVGLVVSLVFIGSLVDSATAVTRTIVSSAGTLVVAQGSPDGQVYFDVPFGDFKVAGKIRGKGANNDLVLQIDGASGALRLKNHSAADLLRVTDAGVFSFDTGTGAFSLAFEGNASFGTISGGGSAEDLILYAAQGTTKGVAVKFRNNSVDNVERFEVLMAAPTSGNTCLAVAYHNGTSVVYDFVTVVAGASVAASGRKFLSVAA